MVGLLRNAANWRPRPIRRSLRASQNLASQRRPAKAAQFPHRLRFTNAGLKPRAYMTQVYAETAFAIPFSRDCHSVSVSFNSAAAMFSSRCLTEEVPGIGMMTGE